MKIDDQVGWMNGGLLLWEHSYRAFTHLGVTLAGALALSVKYQNEKSNDQALVHDEMADASTQNEGAILPYFARSGTFATRREDTTPN